jgi:hypothetical protein
MSLPKDIASLGQHPSEPLRQKPAQRHQGSTRARALAAHKPFTSMGNPGLSATFKQEARFLLAGLIASFPLAASPVFSAPAPPLSYLQIRRVESSSRGLEYVSDNLLSTVGDHGGATLRALTVEVGYGGSRIAKMNGAVLPTSANLSSTPFCNPANFLQPCGPGQTIIGWVRIWKLDGYQSGTFSYQSRSLNSPLNTLFDSIFIR